MLITKVQYDAKAKPLNFAHREPADSGSLNDTAVFVLSDVINVISKSRFNDTYDVHKGNLENVAPLFNIDVNSMFLSYAGVKNIPSETFRKITSSRRYRIGSKYFSAAVNAEYQRLILLNFNSSSNTLMNFIKDNSLSNLTYQNTIQTGDKQIFVFKSSDGLSSGYAVYTNQGRLEEISLGKINEKTKYESLSAKYIFAPTRQLSKYEEVQPDNSKRILSFSKDFVEATEISPSGKTVSKKMFMEDEGKLVLIRDYNG